MESIKPFLNNDGCFTPAIGTALCSELLSVFSQNDLAQHFGLGLCHRHFLLQDDEVLVHAGNIARPVASSTIHAENLSAVAWAFRNGECHPYEFTEDKYGQTDLDPHFAKEIFLILSKHGLGDILGIQRRRQDVNDAEMTMADRVSVRVPLDDPACAGGELVPAYWNFVASKEGEGPSLLVGGWCLTVWIDKDGISVKFHKHGE